MKRHTLTLPTGHGSGEALYGHPHIAPKLRAIARELHLAIFKFLGNPMHHTHHFNTLLIALLLAPLAAIHAADRPLSDFQNLVRTETWTEKWPDAAGQMESRTVTAEVWTQAMQAALGVQETLHIPARAKPYYIDGPIVLKSGQKLTAHPKAEIRLKPGCSTCVVRNENIVGFADQPVPGDLKPDTDIVIEGGIWTTLATSRTEHNGNLRGGSSKQNPVHGTHGVILLHNVRRVTVRNITVRQSKPFAVHFGNARDFTVDGLTLDDHRRDGVHVNGPASHGVIRRVSGDSQDDPVPLTAWDWSNYAPSYGPIHDILIEDITGALSVAPNSWLGLNHPE
ncbi:MAG: hypothetical protein ABIP48_03870 [Planctomycetota bacterium]